jgi:putative transposase
MPRRARQTPAGHVYHVLNRAAGRIALFRKDADYAAFERVMLLAHQRVPLRILDWCIMRNHWHFVVWPRTPTQVTEFFRFLAHTHAMRWRVSRRTVGWGHLYQGRFKAFPVQTDRHFLTVCRYVQRNALTAGVVQRAEQWPWGSLWARQKGPAELRGMLTDGPVARPGHWLELVNAALTPKELARVRLSATRGRPYGEAAWVQQTAQELGIEHTLRREGRPSKAEEQEVENEN